MIGTIVNTATIIAGSIIGSVLHRGVKEKYKEVLYTGLGLASLAIGLNATISHFPQSQYPVLFIISLAIGGVVGTALDIDGRFKRLIDKLKKGGDGENRLADGLATAINRIKESEAKSKVIILLTDGINNQGAVDPLSAAEIAALYNIRLYTIGVGTQGLAPYPFRDPLGHVHYQNVPVELDEHLLTDMAQSTTDGHYFRATNKKSLESIFKEIDQMEKTKIDITQYNQTKDEHLPFLITAVVALALQILLSLTYFKTTP